MSIRLLEHIRDELRGSGAIQNTPEFCTGWLGRSEGYIRTLRFHGLEPSVEALSVCSQRRLHNGLGFWLFGSLIIRLVAQSFQRTQSV